MKYTQKQLEVLKQVRDIRTMFLYGTITREEQKTMLKPLNEIYSQERMKVAK